MVPWILTAVSLTGNMLNCMRIRMCFVIWIACNVGWAMVDITGKTYSRAILDVVQICFSVFGYIEWGKNESHIQKVV